MQPRWDYMLQRIKELGITSILDFGCGQTRLVRELQERLPKTITHYVGVDSIFYKELQKTIFPIPSIFHQTLPDLGIWDLCLASEVLEHLQTREDLLGALKYVQNRCKHLFITYPNVKCQNIIDPKEIEPGWWIGMLNKTTQFGIPIPGHMQWFTHQKIKSLMEAFGFKILDLRILPKNNVFIHGESICMIQTS